jgi:hypothetical protein
VSVQAASTSHWEDTACEALAGVVELVDTPALGAGGRKPLEVRVLSPASPINTGDFDLRRIPPPADKTGSGYPDLEIGDIDDALRYAAEALRERELPLVPAG